MPVRPGSLTCNAYGRDSSKAGEIAKTKLIRKRMRADRYAEDYFTHRQADAFSTLLRPMVPSITSLGFHVPPTLSGNGLPVDLRHIRTLEGRRCSVLVSAAATLPKPLTQNLKLFCTMRGLRKGGQNEVKRLRVRCDARDQKMFRLPRIKGTEPLQTTADFNDKEWEAAINGRMNEQEFVRLATHPIKDPL